MIYFLTLICLQFVMAAPREVPFSRDLTGDGKPEVARVHLERNQGCENRNLQEMAQKFIELSLGSGKRVLRLAEVCEPFDALEAEEDWKYEFKVVLQKKDFGILLIERSLGDFIGQEFVLASKDDLRVVLEYSHGNFDGQSQFKIDKDGSVVFRAAMGLEAEVEGQKVKFPVVARGKGSKKKNKKIECDEKNGHELGFESKFNFETKTFSAPNFICY